MIGGILDREINRNQQISTNFKLSIEKTLQNSFGCVNAIKYTDKLILTGGDDKRILVYDNDYNLTQYKGHISNIFSIDAIGTKIYSTGNDGYLMEYDINQVCFV